MSGTQEAEESSAYGTEQQRRSSWNHLANWITRLADAADMLDYSFERRGRENAVEATTTGRATTAPAEPIERAASSSARSQSLGGLLRQFSGRQESISANDSEESPVGESTASAAERHRLTGTSSIDLQAFHYWIEKNTPFVIILSCLFIAEHAVGILVFASMTIVVATGNAFMRRQVALKDGKSNGRVIVMIMALSSVAGGLMWWAPGQCLPWRSLILLMPAKVDTVWDCLYCASVADGLVRLASLVVKMGLLLLHKTSPEESIRRRSQLLSLLEHFSLLYRSIVPTPLWFVYLYKSRGVMPSIFTGAFLALKCQLVYEKANNCLGSLKSVWMREMQFGKYVTAEELVEIGNSCAICQEPMTRPFQLSNCRHVFCDACLTEWLERQNTCPMCRATIRPPGMQAVSDGSVPLLPQLF